MSIKTVEDVKSKTYSLTAPWIFKEEELSREVSEGDVVVKPVLASVCHADLRYFTGKRRKEALQKKLPMALFHEGVGVIVKSNHPDRKVGERVVIVPNIPEYLVEGTTKEECCSSCKRGLADNYCEQGVFMGSGYDGIGQEHVVIPSECAVLIPEEVPEEIAVLAELSTVSLHAIERTAASLDDSQVAVFGDGPVGYLTAVMLHYVFHVPKDRLRVFGAVREKLEQFTFAETHLVQEYDFKSAEPVHLAIECAGGPFSESASNQAIDLLARGGDLVLMGVTEERVPINTRDLLEKGLSLHGSSRSSVPDYQRVIEAMRQRDCREAFKKLLPNNHVIVKGVNDLNEVMKQTAEHKAWKKTIISFEW
ncbi:alcohol dehydrogenase catalytic domain-containing protein [Halobacillus naozhouensis]|uniref:Alcohol dehydrogenase catalytic domain-containing protein n=1 Tax=Halobacillus naozhouensis TaxID=554880 RepID=A0ABY8IWT2_9BACI|nr:alcohol dehydrogenase catalytic domain-containing protein [Halobacillus naozhouensis]WFT74206.1 alcohol dehydrogenase catalytic domain-containing protein [Halobacillus naozhouensis]